MLFDGKKIRLPGHGRGLELALAPEKSLLGFNPPPWGQSDSSVWGAELLLWLPQPLPESKATPPLGSRQPPTSKTPKPAGDFSLFYSERDN